MGLDWMWIYLTPEWPRIREFIRISIAPLKKFIEMHQKMIFRRETHRTQDSGMLVWMGS
jgi:hypothetical protein